MNKLIGITCLFRDPNAVIHAAEKLRDKGYRRFDFHTPYPVHGLDEAMGVKRTILPWISLLGGIAGLAIATHMMWWTGAVDYRLIVGGKPYFAFEPSIPIMFELTVLLCATATTVGMFALNKLPKWHNKWQDSPHFLLSTDDAFVLTIDATDQYFHRERTAELLEAVGAQEIRIVERHDQ